MSALVVPARFNGPERSGNGGYTAGLLAATLDGTGAVEVTLRSPVPLDTPLRPVLADGSARLLDGETLVAEARGVDDFGLEVPDGVGPDDARAAMGRYRGRSGGPFSRCFVCGLDRDDALGVFAGPVEGNDVVATTWTPDPELAGAGGIVPAEIVWSVLDCPTYFAAYRDEEGTISFLARLTGRLEGEVRAGEEHVVIAWPLGVDGRKREAGAAVLSGAGTVLARARALMIEPRAG
jgi:hypothetical protein